MFMDRISDYHTDVGCDADTTMTWSDLCPAGHITHESTETLSPGNDSTEERQENISLQPANALYGKAIDVMYSAICVMEIGHVNIGIIFLFIGNSQLCLYSTQSIPNDAYTQRK